MQMRAFLDLASPKKPNASFSCWRRRKTKCELLDLASSKKQEPPFLSSCLKHPPCTVHQRTQADDSSFLRISCCCPVPTIMVCFALRYIAKAVPLRKIFFPLFFFFRVAALRCLAVPDSQTRVYVHDLGCTSMLYRCCHHVLFVVRYIPVSPVSFVCCTPWAIDEGHCNSDVIWCNWTHLISSAFLQCIAFRGAFSGAFCGAF